MSPQELAKKINNIKDRLHEVAEEEIKKQAEEEVRGVLRLVYSPSSSCSASSTVSAVATSASNFTTNVKYATTAFNIFANAWKDASEWNSAANGDSTNSGGYSWNNSWVKEK